MLDSLYNFLPGIKLKGRGRRRPSSPASRPRSATRPAARVCFVDHSPWPTEGNRGQRRGTARCSRPPRSLGHLPRAGRHRSSSRRVATTSPACRAPRRPGTPSSWSCACSTPSQTDDLADPIEDFLRRNPGAVTVIRRRCERQPTLRSPAELEDNERFVRVPPILFGSAETQMLGSRRGRSGTLP